MRIGSKLRRLLFELRRAGQTILSAAIVIGSATLLYRGAFPDLRTAETGLVPLTAVCLLATLVLAKLVAKMRHPSTLPAVHFASRRPALLGDEDPPTLFADLELGSALLVALYVTLQLSGGMHSPLHPLVYGLVAFLATFHRTVVGVVLMLTAVSLEIFLYHAAAPSNVSLSLFVWHLVFISLSALAHLIFLQAEVLRQRREHRTSIQREICNLREEARDFRLISASLSADPKVRSRNVDEDRLAIGAVETIHETLFYTLELLKQSLNLHTCILLWLDDSGEHLKIKEMVTDSDCIVDVPISANSGALGTVVKNRLMVNLKDPKRGHLPYYAAPEQVGSFLGVPVLEDGHLRGVVCADRDDSRPFTATDEELLTGAATQMLRAIQSERVFAAVERAKYEHERFFGALSGLNNALTAEDVCTTTFKTAREISDFDFAAITLFDRMTRRHTVLSTHGEVPRGLDGLSFGENAGITSMVVKNKHFLPAGGEVRDKDALIYTKKIRLPNMESLLVLPLIVADEAIGSFAVASRRARAFTKHKRDMLGVIANHIAVSLSNAQMYGRMEAMATTDGLTGLFNHRNFQERIVEILARAERTSGRQAIILTDIDHFKKVNDTYGHPVGDVVLKGVADVVLKCVRKIDIAARYGGEEFALVLEGTDLAGARLFAERIRQEVQKEIFQSQSGPFSVTLSLGISVYPDDGRDAKTLIAAADKALYDAKHGGRNRACAFSDRTSPTGKLKLAR